jgi:general secretion pathway protein J
MSWRQATRGLTLIEVLVALALWGLITALMTRGLELITRSQIQQTERQDTQQRLQSALAQWQTDLNQLDTPQPGLMVLDWNGRVLRLLRRSAAPKTGWRMVVAWSLHEGRWVRWQSAPFQTRAEGAAAWDAALLAWASTPGAEGALRHQGVAASDWRVLFFRNDSWSHAMSSRGANDFPIPDGIRLQLDLNAQGSWQGPLQWDWVRPSWSVNRS